MKRIRGLVSLGALGAVVGVVTNVVGVTVGSLRMYGLLPLPIELSMAASAGALGGFVFGSGFGLVIAAIGARRSLQDLSLWRIAMAGLAVGAAVPALVTLVVAGPDVVRSSLSSVLSASTTWGVFGGVVATAMVAAAQRAERAEIDAGAPYHRLPAADR